MKKSNITALGFSSLLTQIFLIREAGIWLKGNEFIIAVIVATWLFWTATGSLLAHKFIKKNPQKYFWGFWFAAVAFSVGELIALKLFWSFTGGLPGESFDLLRAAGLAFAITALPCIFSGAAFAGALIFFEKRGAYAAISSLYLYETIGAVIAGIIVTFILIPLQIWWFSIALLFVVPLCFFNKKLIVFAMILLAVAAWGNKSLNEFSNKIAGNFLTGSIVVNENLPIENITITERGGEAAFYLGGRLVGASRQKEFAEEIAGYASLLLPEKKKALLIGFPFNGLIREMIESGFEVVVPEPQMEIPEIIEKYLLPEDRTALSSQNVKIIPMDFRVFAEKARQKSEKFDAIIQNVGIPEAYSVARLYSRKWFSDLSVILKTNGVLTVVLPGSAGYVPDELARVIARTFSTLDSKFNFTTIVPASSTLLLASDGLKIPVKPALWTKKLKSKKTKWFNTALIEDNLNFYRVAQFTNACAKFAKLKIQTDDLPLGYGDALLYSEARFSGGLKNILSAIYTNPKRVFFVSIFCVVVWIFAFFATKNKKIKVWMAMTAFSLAGFVGEMTAMIRFTIACGNLYFAVGFLFAGFMLGLAAAIALSKKIKFARGKLLKLYSFFLAVIVIAAALIKMPSGIFGAVCAVFLLNFLCGYFVGGGFALLTSYASEEGKSGIIIYVADLLGATLGALLFSIIIPPVLGFTFLTILSGIIISVTFFVFAT